MGSEKVMVEFRLAGSAAGVVLMVAAVALFHCAAAPVVLDKRMGRVRRGRRWSKHRSLIRAVEARSCWGGTVFCAR